MTSTQEPNWSAFGGKFIYIAGITVITFLPYDGSERVKLHRALPVKVHVSSTHLSKSFAVVKTVASTVKSRFSSLAGVGIP
ncbi:hypothetical protein TNCV_2847411 [Trichonephila clavipes]|nr:hypothetical protein TNCV_2847411 [Trichonephila clavipes]